MLIAAVDPSKQDLKLLVKYLRLVYSQCDNETKFGIPKAKINNRQNFTQEETICNHTTI